MPSTEPASVSADSPRVMVEIERPKSPTFTVPFWLDETVRWFDVAVQNAHCVRGFETGDDLQHRHRPPRVTGSGPPLFNPFLQRAALDQLHGDDGRAFDLLGAIDIDGVRMIDGCGEPALAEEAFARIRRIERMPEHLQRDATSAGEILRFIDRAHARLSERPHDPIAAKIERLGIACPEERLPSKPGGGQNALSIDAPESWLARPSLSRHFAQRPLASSGMSAPHSRH